MAEKKSIGTILRENAVTVMFVLLCILCMVYSGQSVQYVIYELFGRLNRNAFIVLALIIPIIAGMGVNFAITIGAMAAQIAILWVIEWDIPGIGGWLTAAALTVPLAGFFGFLIGKLMNKMKGQEMIGGMILGYFANGLYQLLFLFIFGNLIPLTTPGLVIKGSTGVANTIDLSRSRSNSGGIHGALDNLWRVDFTTALYIALGLVLVYAIVLLLTKPKHSQDVQGLNKNQKKSIALLVVTAVTLVLYQFPFVKELFALVRVPIVTFLVVVLLCIFNTVLMRTRLGQQFRAVGQNRVVANAAGISPLSNVTLTVSNILRSLPG